jgi:hypothetical protein
MKRHRKVLLYAEAFQEGFAEMGCELGIPVTDDFGRESKPSEYIVVIKLCHSWTGD